MLYMFATSFFPGIQFVYHPQIDLKSLRVQKRMNSKKLQYNALEILKNIQDRKFPDTFATIALLFEDIYHKEDGNYVFGIANGQTKTGVFSFARYDNRFYGLEENQNLLDVRAVKIMIHEMGHIFGLRHCIFFSCLMNGSNHMEETDSKPFLFCPVCARKIHHVLKFNIAEWYQGILNGLMRFRDCFVQFIEWYSMRAHYLTSNNK